MDFHPLSLNLPPFYPNGNGDCECNHSRHGDYDGNHRPSFPSEMELHGPLQRVVVRSDALDVLAQSNSAGNPGRSSSNRSV